MKKLFLLLIVLFSMSCTVQKSLAPDDVYATHSQPVKETPITDVVSRTYYDDYTNYQSDSLQSEENITINFNTYPNYSFFISPYTYWYTTPYFYYDWYTPFYGYNPYYNWYPYYYGWNYYNYYNHNNWNNHRGGYYGPRHNYNVHNPRTKPNQRQTPPKYNRSGKIQNYTPSDYRQPRSSQEYMNRNRNRIVPNNERSNYSTPAKRNQSNYFTSPRNNGNNYNNSRVAPSQRSNSTPRSNPSYSNPTPRSNPNYSTPRSNPSPRYNSPSPRSNPSYSAPRSNPSPSYSAPRSSPSPSRSSGSGGRR